MAAAATVVAAAAAAADALIKKHETREDKHGRGARTEELRDRGMNSATRSSLSLKTAAASDN